LSSTRAARWSQGGGAATGSAARTSRVGSIATSPACHHRRPGARRPPRTITFVTFSGRERSAFEARFVNNLVLALDRYLVHRIRMVADKDGNQLNEVEMLCDSLMNNNGILRDSTVIKLIPDRSAVKLRIGDPSTSPRTQFERLSAAFFAELERKFP
jgi:hypothetical protein